MPQQEHAQGSDEDIDALLLVQPPDKGDERGFKVLVQSSEDLQTSRKAPRPNLLQQGLLAPLLAAKIVGGIGRIEGCSDTGLFRFEWVQVRGIDAVGDSCKGHATLGQDVPKPAGEPVVFGLLQFPGIVFAHGVEQGIMAGGEEGIEGGGQTVRFYKSPRQPGNRIGERQIGHLLMVADSRVMDRHQAAGLPEIAAQPGTLVDQGRHYRGVGVMAVNDIGPLVEQHH